MSKILRLGIWTHSYTAWRIEHETPLFGVRAYDTCNNKESEGQSVTQEKALSLAKTAHGVMLAARICLSGYVQGGT